MSRLKTALILIAAVAAGLALLLYVDASRRGQSLTGRLVQLIGGSEAPARPLEPPARGATIEFLAPEPIGHPAGERPPWISHLAVVDLDGDGRQDVVVCDATRSEIAWIRQEPGGRFQERPIAASIPAPAHVTPVDLDQDGDVDLLISVMGTILPNNDKIGAVVVLENDGEQRFARRVLLENVARVTDIRPGDFDQDGDLDLAVGQFGYYEGEIRWMENRGDWQFESHQLLDLPGTIHTPVGDLDGDGDLDIAAVVSQEWEEIYVFENDGQGGFQRRRVYGSTNEDFGSSGLALADVDLDGDLDMLYTNGDAFDYSPPGPRPWHGVQWLENMGGLEFAYHRVGDFPGAFSAIAADLDGDGDQDIAVVSAFNDWEDEGAQSFGWFENDGQMRFTQRTLAFSPTHLLALAAGDMDEDGWVDLVTGGMYTHPPYDRMGRVTLWRNLWPERREAP